MDGFLDDSNGEQQDGYAAGVGVGAGGGAGAGAGARMASFPALAGTASSPPSTRALPASLAMLHGAAVSTSRRSVFDDVDDYDNVGDATFEEDDTAVYRSVKAAPAMPQVQAVATGSELGTTQGLTRRKLGSLDSLAGVAIASHEQQQPTGVRKQRSSGTEDAAKLRVQRALEQASQQPQTVQFPGVLSPYKWDVTARSNVRSALQAVAEALDQQGVSWEIAKGTCKFSCVALAHGYTPVRFVVTLYDAPDTEGYLLEFARTVGDCMAWAEVYHRITASLPDDMQPPLTFVERSSHCPTATTAVAATAVTTTAATAATAGATDDDGDFDLDLAAIPPPPPLAPCGGGGRGGASTSTNTGGFEARVPEQAVPRLAAGDVAPLLAMASSTLIALQRDSTQAFASLSERPGNAVVLLQEGVLGTMVALVAFSQDWTVVQAAVTCIANIAGALFDEAAPSRATATERQQAAKVLQPCIGMLAAEVANPTKSKLTREKPIKDLLWTQCCRTLAAITKSPACARLVLPYKLDASPALTGSAKHTGDVGEYARTTLLNLAQACA